MLLTVKFSRIEKEDTLWTKNFNLLNLLISEHQTYHSHETFLFIYFNIFLIKTINLIVESVYF